MFCKSFVLCIKSQEMNNFPPSFELQLFLAPYEIYPKNQPQLMVWICYSCHKPLLPDYNRYYELIYTMGFVSMKWKCQILILLMLIWINIRPVEMKKILGGAMNYEILLATMVGRRKKFCISNRLKRLKKFNICSR